MPKNTADVLRSREIGGRVSKSTKHGLKITATKGKLDKIPQKDLGSATANERHARGVVIGESIARDNLKPTEEQVKKKNLHRPNTFGFPKHLEFSPGTTVLNVNARADPVKHKASSTKILVPKRGKSARDVIAKETPAEREARKTAEHAKSIRLQKKHFKEQKISTLRKKAMNRNVSKNITKQ